MTTPETTIKLPKDGPFLIRHRARIGSVLLLLLLPLLIFSSPHWEQGSIAAYLMETVGYTCLVGGVLFRIWCTMYIGGRKSTALQTTGPYSLVRHPLYLGSFLIGLGVAATAQSLAVLALVLAYFWLQYTATISYEEKLLSQRFPADYAAYRQRVPCFIPRLTGYIAQVPDTIDYRPLRSELRHAAVYLAVLPLLALISVLHQAGVLPMIQLP